MNVFPIQGAATGRVKHNGSAYVMKDGVASSVTKVSPDGCGYGSRLSTPQHKTTQYDPSDLELNIHKVHVLRHHFVPLLSQATVLVTILLENNQMVSVVAVFLLGKKKTNNNLCEC